MLPSPLAARGRGGPSGARRRRALGGERRGERGVPSVSPRRVGDERR